MNDNEKLIYLLYKNRKLVMWVFNNRGQIWTIVAVNQSSILWIFIIIFLTELLMIKIYIGFAQAYTIGLRRICKSVLRLFGFIANKYARRGLVDPELLFNQFIDAVFEAY